MNGKMLSAVGNRYKYVVAELPPISGNGCLLSYARYGMCVCLKLHTVRISDIAYVRSCF